VAPKRAFWNRGERSERSGASDASVPVVDEEEEVVPTEGSRSHAQAMVCPSLP
jgi:hypothetical protein